jgi:hypothetical protein
MIIRCKHGKEVKAQLDWDDAWQEYLRTHKPMQDGNEELRNMKPAGVSRDKFNEKEFLRLVGCPHCKWIEAENN